VYTRVPPATPYNDEWKMLRRWCSTLANNAYHRERPISDVLLDLCSTIFNTRDSDICKCYARLYLLPKPPQLLSSWLPYCMQRLSICWQRQRTPSFALVAYALLASVLYIDHDIDVFVIFSEEAICSAEEASVLSQNPLSVHICLPIPETLWIDPGWRRFGTNIF